MKSDIKELISCPNFPVLSLIVGLGLSQEENEKKIKNSLVAAFSQIPKAAMRIDREIFLARLNLMLQELAIAGHPQSLAIFLAREFCRIQPLNYAALDRMVIDRACAISEVVFSSSMFPLFDVVVLSDNSVRVFRGTGNQMVERKNCQLATDLMHRMKNRVGKIKAGRGDKAMTANTQDSYNLALGDAFLALIKSLEHPVILIGSDRLDELSSPLENCVAAGVEGDFEFVSDAEIARLSEELKDKWIDNRVRNERFAIERFRQLKKLGAGINETAALLEEDRVDKLYLEALPNADSPSPTSHKLTAADKLVALALKFDGEVIFLPAGSLSEYEGVVAGLRY